jgi:HK97 family phage major capsid protein
MSQTADTTEEVLKQITTTDLGDSGTLPRAMFDEFFTEVQNESVILDMVRTVPMGRDKMRIPKLGVGERLRSSQAENTAQNDTGVSTDHVDLDAEKSSIYWSLTHETVDENPEREGLADTIMSLMAQQWAVDTEDLGFVGDSTGSGFVAQNDGWLKILQDRGAPTYDHKQDNTSDSTDNPTPQPISTDLFNQAIQTIDSKYLRADPAFLVNKKQVQAYANSLTDRQDGLGATVLMGDSDLTPFGYDIVGSAMVPENEAVFTVPENLIYGLRHNDTRINTLRESDEVFDNDLYAKYRLIGKDDFEVEDENAAVYISGIQSPTA